MWVGFLRLGPVDICDGSLSAVGAVLGAVWKWLAAFLASSLDDGGSPAPHYDAQKCLQASPGVPWG